MARRRFFVDEIRRGKAELIGEDAEHLVRVLRVEPGQIFEISDNRLVYLAQVETARKSLVEFRIEQELPLIRPAVQVTLVVALFKFDRFEWLVEKATELGVTAVQPFEAVRTERGLVQAAAKRQARWKRIALEASQQSRRAHLPVVNSVVSFRSALEGVYDSRLLLDEESERPGLPEMLGTKPRHVGLLLGPEGGWTETERKSALDEGWQACSLGPTILRAETAGVAAIAVVNAAYVGGVP